MKDLIEKVRRYTVLYNTSHPDYAKKSLKESIWQEIAEELNYADGEEAKSVWLKLRNCHRDALRRKDCKNKSGSTSKRCRTWKYERQMAFLLKYMIRTATSNIQEESNEETYQTLEPEDEQNIKLEDDCFYYQEVENNPLDPEETDNTCIAYENDKTFEMQESKRNTLNILEPQVNITQKQKKMKRTTVEDIVNKTILKQEERADRIARRQTDHDDLYHFYMSMYGITRKLPLARQLIVKRKIFDMIIEEEEKMMSINNDEDSKNETPMSVNLSDTNGIGDNN